MQLLTKERKPARRKLPATISNLNPKQATPHAKTTTRQKRTSDSKRTTSKQDTETTPHHSAMLDTETPPNSASTSGPSKTTTSNTLFPGAYSHHTRRTTAQVKDVISASKKNS